MTAPAGIVLLASFPKSGKYLVPDFPGQSRRWREWTNDDTGRLRARVCEQISQRRSSSAGSKSTTPKRPRLQSTLARRQPCGPGGCCAIKHGFTAAKERRITRREHEHILKAVQRRLDEHPDKDEPATPDSRASVRHDKVVDGIDALPKKNAQARRHPNGAARPDLETRDEDFERWRIDGGNPRISHTPWPIIRRPPRSLRPIVWCLAVDHHGTVTSAGRPSYLTALPRGNVRSRAQSPDARVGMNVGPHSRAPVLLATAAGAGNP